MLNKFRAKGEYLYAGLFAISLVAILYKPIQQHFEITNKEKVVYIHQSQNQTIINKEKTTLKISQYINNGINNLGTVWQKKSAQQNFAFLDMNGKYKHITLDNLYENNDYHNMFFKDNKADFTKSRKLADYISSHYKINLQDAEMIVLDTYKESIRHSLEPLLVLSLIETESSYKQYNVSPFGAIGLTQVYPIYHGNKIKQLKSQNLELSSIKGNIKIGSLILKEYIQLSNGNIANGLQRYNGSLGDKSYKYSKKVFKKMSLLENLIKV